MSDTVCMHYIIERLVEIESEKNNMSNDRLGKFAVEKMSILREELIYNPVSYTHLTLPTKRIV